LLGTIATALVGCQKKAAQTPPPVAPTVPVARIVEREVTDFSEYTGRTDSEVVTIRPQVTGELKAMPFVEGSEVKGPVKNPDGTIATPGDLLCQIDPTLYKAAVDQAEGQLDLYKAQKSLAEANYAQDKQGFDAGTISKYQITQDLANVAQAEARIKQAEGSLRAARANLDYCTIRSPISGRVSRYFYPVGTVVTANSTALTTVAPMDRIYGYFDVEERVFQRVLAGSTGALPAVNVRMAIEGDPRPYPYKGALNFVNNQVNPSTGTVALRAVFDNERTQSGLWKFLPGMFVRIRLELGAPHPAALVVDRAIGSEQGDRYVYVVDKDNKVRTRRVELGALQEDGLRVIAPYRPKSDKDPEESGVKPDELVVVGGLPQLRPGVQIQPEVLKTMPTGADPAPRRKSPGDGKAGGAKPKA
jgi:multidrug efflux system membrane fusion protein